MGPRTAGTQQCGGPAPQHRLAAYQLGERLARRGRDRSSRNGRPCRAMGGPQVGLSHRPGSRQNSAPPGDVPSQNEAKPRSPIANEPGRRRRLRCRRARRSRTVTADPARRGGQREQSWSRQESVHRPPRSVQHRSCAGIHPVPAHGRRLPGSPTYRGSSPFRTVAQDRVLLCLAQPVTDHLGRKLGPDLLLQQGTQRSLAITGRNPSGDNAKCSLIRPTAGYGTFRRLLTGPSAGNQPEEARLTHRQQGGARQHGRGAAQLQRRLVPLTHPNDAPEGNQDDAGLPKGRDERQRGEAQRGQGQPVRPD